MSNLFSEAMSSTHVLLEFRRNKSIFDKYFMFLIQDLEQNGEQSN